MSCVLFVPIHRSVIETPIDRGLSPAEATDPKAIRRELGTVLLQWAPAGELNRIVGCLTHGTADRPLAPPYNKALATSAKLQLTEFPLCAMCLARKVITPATVADHITPHKGDHQSFYWGELQSLCQHCHSSRKKQQETHGYQRDIGADGWPTDPNHPANKPRS